MKYTIMMGLAFTCAFVADKFPEYTLYSIYVAGCITIYGLYLAIKNASQDA